MVGFIRGKMQRRFQGGFSILLTAEEVLRVLVEKLKISRIAVLPHSHRQQRLILNLSAQPDRVTSSVNDTTDKDIAPESMQFG